MSDLRPEFHHEIDALHNDVARLGANVVELIPRVTEILLEQVVSEIHHEGVIF